MVYPKLDNFSKKLLDHIMKQDPPARGRKTIVKSIVHIGCSFCLCLFKLMVSDIFVIPVGMSGRRPIEIMHPFCSANSTSKMLLAG